MFNVMIVDDENIVHRMLEDYIGRFHKELKITQNCYNGKDALDKLSKSAVDIVITDIKMPEIDGIELIKKIHDIYPECVIIVISAYGEFKYAQEAMAAGVFLYLLKPIDFKELSTALIKIVGKLNRISSVCPEEQIISDLIFGAVSDAKQLDERIERAALPASFAKSGGCLYKFSILPCKSLNEWKYGLDTIDNMLVNIIKFFINDIQVLIAAKKNMDFYIVTLGRSISDTELDINILTEYIYSETGFNCSIEIIDQFDSLYELPDNSVDSVKTESNLKIEEFENLSGIVKTAVEYINKNYQNDVSRNDIADIVRISPEYFSHCFRKETGYTFLQYLTKVRMNKAVELIDDGAKISDVIAAVGYMSKNRFYSNFKAYTSYTPSEYRRIRNNKYEK